MITNGYTIDELVQLYEQENEPLEFMYESKRGCGVWRKKEPHGGYSYWTDDIGGGRRMWDEALDDWEMLVELMHILPIVEPTNDQP